MLDGEEAARLVLRGVVGSAMVAHGAKHARSLEGTGRWFAGIGFREPELQARASAVVEIGAGAALIIGAATPAAAAAVVGTMGVAARTVHVQNGYFITGEGYEYVLALSGAAVALAALGGGRYSVDQAAGMSGWLRGTAMALGALTAGVAGAAIQLALFWRAPAAA